MTTENKVFDERFEKGDARYGPTREYQRQIDNDRHDESAKYQDQLEEQRSVERQTRAAVQGNGDARVPRECRAPASCPLRDCPALGQAIPSTCLNFCHVTFESLRNAAQS